VNYRFLLVFLFLFQLQTAGSYSQELARGRIAFTFEKLPAMSPMGFWTPREISNQILRVLEEENIQAIGFVVQEKIDDDPGSIVVLDDWLKKGQLLGNNTYSYVDFNEISERDFLQHIADGQKSIRQASLPTRIPYRHFRFPMLHEGNSESKKKNLYKRLQNADYKIIQATVIPTDFEFNHVLAQVEEQDGPLESLRELYLEHFLRCLEYSESQSEKVFGSQIAQILRLHMGISTAQFFPDVIRLLKEKGYRFISVAEAMSDPLYSTEENYFGELGLSFIDKVAATQGKEFDPDTNSITRSEIRRRLGIR
jgi:peptidoglycan/xylan/chitin deacetylase (PgdA/CDA1 family)